MANWIRLLKSTENYMQEYQRLQHEAETARYIEFTAAVSIQTWFRAIRVRAYLRHLRECTTLIQRRWRGYRARVCVYRLRREKVHIMRSTYYHCQATKIQALFRGYLSRKHIFSYAMRKRYYQCLQNKNEIVRNQLNEMAHQQQMNAESEIQRATEHAFHEYAETHHHLISTSQVPGIYNSPYLMSPHEMEIRLRQVKVPKFKRVMSSLENRNKMVFEPAWMSQISVLQSKGCLPPVPCKPQGPFRDPCEVQAQRYRPLSPTLRTATDYDALDKARALYRESEGVKCISDETFDLHRRPWGLPYDPMLHPTGQYGCEGYPFREVNRQKWIDRCQKDFQRLLPPIPTFDKFNLTYSKGQV